MKKIMTFAASLFCACWAVSQETVNLAGDWDFQIDRNDKGVAERWYERASLDDEIELPASMPQRLKGDDVTVETKWVGSLYDSSFFYNPYMEKYRRTGNVKLPFFLTPDKHYVGVAWYNKTVSMDRIEKGKRYFLFLERPHIETTLWVNGHEVGMQNSLSVPHRFEVTEYLKKGENVFSVRIDNRVETVGVGIDSHSVTDQTQGDWNGIVGRMELQEFPVSFMDDIQVYPDIKDKKASVKIAVVGKPGEKVNISLSAKAFNTAKMHNVDAVGKEIKLTADTTVVDIDMPMGDGMLLWDEFSPALYKLTAVIEGKGGKQTKTSVFGMREITINGKMFYVNGRLVQLRGTVENCDFPITGYPPTNVDEWIRIFRVCREYGLNHMRFHSYCPPEAAFEAADIVGFYIQPEGPSWPNHGVKLGNGMKIDTYLMDETKAIVKEYGNHPSFCMLACGNEPAGNWVAWVSDFVDYWKNADSRRVYTGASVGGGWQWQPKSQYHVKAGARGLAEWRRRAPETLSDFRANIDTVSQPYVSHETGQWCVFPNFDEITKYYGVNKAKNFEIFRDILNDNNMGGLAEKFVMASGKLQALCNKYEIERTLRTPNYAGFQLLALNDYSGQGTALVGVTDVFFEEKGYIDAAGFRRFCSPVVPLARIPKFTYTADEHFKADIEVSQFSDAVLEDARPYYEVKDSRGKIYAKGNLNSGDIEIGGQKQVGSIDIPLNGIEEATKLNLEVRIPGTASNNEGSDAVNDWNFWVYPSQVRDEKGNVYITDTLDAEAKEVLKNGGRVLVTAAGKISYGKEVVQYFTPVFWNTSWFKMRPPHTTGVSIDDKHSIFEIFPTDYHSDLQWWELVNRAQVMQFTDFPADFQPIVQSIDTWFLSRKIGMLFEANVLGGKLVMTTMDIVNNLDKRIVARQLRASILKYMNSEKFKPAFTLDCKLIDDLFTKRAPKVDMYTKDSPDELKPKLKK